MVNFIKRLQMFFILGPTSSTYLKQRKANIINSFTTMVTNLEDLQKEQETYSNDISKKISELTSELDLVSAEEKSTKQMITKIKNLID